MKKLKMRCRRGLALLLVCTMCMGTMAGTAFAAEEGTTGAPSTETSSDKEGGETGGGSGAKEDTGSTDDKGSGGQDNDNGGSTQDKPSNDGTPAGKPESTNTPKDPVVTHDSSQGTTTTTTGEKTEWKDGNGDVVAEKDTSTSQTIKDGDGTLQSETKKEEYHEGPTESTETIEPKDPADPAAPGEPTTPGTTESGTPEGPGTTEPGTPEGPGAVEPGTPGSEDAKPEEKPGEPTDVKDWSILGGDGTNGNIQLDENGNPIVVGSGENGVTVDMTPGGTDWVGITVDSDTVAKIIADKMESEKPEGVEVSDYKDESTGEEGFQFKDADGKTHIVIKVMDPTTNKLVGYKKMIITTTTTPGDSGATDGTQIGGFDPDDPNAPPAWNQPNKGGTVTKIDLPERPQASETVDETTGNKTTITVEELYDVDEAGNIVRDGEGNPVVVGYLKKTIVTDGAGNQLSGSQEAVWGIRTTVVTNGDTTATIEDQMNVSTNVSFITKATTIEGFQVNVKDVVGGAHSGVWGSMGEVEEGPDHGNVEEKDMKPEITEPNEGETNKTTDLYHREDAKYLGFVVTAAKLDIYKTDSDGNLLDKSEGNVKKDEKVYVYKCQKIDGKIWGEIGDNQWICLDEGTKASYIVRKEKTTVYTDLNDWNSGFAWPSKNTELPIFEYKKDAKGTLWGRTEYDGQIGWTPLTKGGPWNTLYGESTVAPEAKEGQYIFLGEYGLESAIRINGQGKNGNMAHTWQAHQFKIWDENGNPVYVYCADFQTSPQKGTDYGKKDIIEGDIWSNEAEKNKEIAEHIQAIAANGYWGTKEGTGSLEAVKKMLLEAIKQDEDKKPQYLKGITESDIALLTDGMALAATQAAIWSYGTTGKKIDVKNPFGEYNYGQYTSDLPKGKDLKVAKALYDYLREQNDVPAAITADSITGTSITVKTVEVDEQGKPKEVDGAKVDKGNKAYTYNTDVSFILNVKPSQINDDLIVQILDKEGNVLTSRRLAGENSGDISYDKVRVNADGSYTITDVKLNEGTEITLRLSGIRLTNQAYLITAKNLQGEEDHRYAQTFVSASETKQTVDLSVDLKFNVREPVVTVEKTETVEKELISTVEREWKKTSETNYTYKTPEDPKDPDEPNTPSTPNTPTTPTTTRTRRDRSSGTPISDTPTPLASIADDPAPLAMLPEEPVPLAILDEDVPLASVPATGDISGLWYVLTLFAGLGLMGMGTLSGKKRKDA